MDSLSATYTRESSGPEGQEASLTTTLCEPGDGPFPNQRTVSRNFRFPLPKGLPPAELAAREERFLADVEAALQRFQGEAAVPGGLLLSAGVQVRLEAMAGVRMDSTGVAAGYAPLTFESTFHLNLPAGMDMEEALLVGQRLAKGVQELVAVVERGVNPSRPTGTA